MPTPVTHAFMAAAIGAAFMPERRAGRFVALATVLSTLPDVDVVGLQLGIAYESFWGHRGILHSLTFALAASLLVAWAVFRDGRPFSKGWWGPGLFFFAVMAMHDLLDAMTCGGLGVALFSPFDPSRHFLPWRLIPVAPIGLFSFFRGGGLDVLATEVLGLWMPTALICSAAWIIRRRTRNRRAVKAQALSP